MSEKREWLDNGPISCFYRRDIRVYRNEIRLPASIHSLACDCLGFANALDPAGGTVYDGANTLKRTVFYGRFCVTHASGRDDICDAHPG